MGEMPTIGYLPAGYALRDRQEGALVMGFGGVEGQVALYYSRSQALSDLILPLTVHVGPVGAPSLTCTENRAGVELAVGELSAVYHDGWWAPGPGYDAQTLPDGTVFHWRREDVHSLTLHLSSATIAVRGARMRDVGLDELRRVVSSVRLP